MTEPTPELVKQFWDYMSSHYDSKIIKRTDSIGMKVIARFLSMIHAMDAETFMKDFATTIGRRIYIPFNIGEANDGSWSLWSQIVICVHEHQHVYQYDKEGQTFMWKYLLRSAGRAHYEADAYRCNLEMHYWRTGAFLNTQGLAESLKAYKCNATDIKVTQKQFDLSIETLKQGAIIADSSRQAIKWLDYHAPELRK